MNEDRKSKHVSLDIIIPIYNEKDVLPHLLKRLGGVFHKKACQLNRISNVAFIFVDDGRKFPIHDEPAQLTLEGYNYI